MMKTLYISDLDGTLFSPDAQVTDFTADAVNSLIDKGMYFTFATARSVYSAKVMTEKLKINVPCILMNGVSVFSLADDFYIKNSFIPEEVSAQVIDAFERNNVNCFAYKIQNGLLTAYFTELTSKVMEAFAEERRRRFGKPFVQCQRFMPDSNTVYFTATGEYSSLLNLKEDICGIKGADYAFYEDNYTNEWYFEVFSYKASKYNGVSFLREQYGFDRIVGFGDNLNDISLFKACDYKIAVGNAKPELKALADEVILPNSENGAARWLLENAVY